MVYYRVRIDKQGRVLIPSDVRKKLGLNANSELVLTVRNNSIILELVDLDLEKEVDEWFDRLVNLKVEAKGLSIEEGKWMSDEYVERKLGID